MPHRLRHLSHTVRVCRAGRIYAPGVNNTHSTTTQHQTSHSFILQTHLSPCPIAHIHIHLYPYSNSTALSPVTLIQHRYGIQAQNRKSWSLQENTYKGDQEDCSTDHGQDRLCQQIRCSVGSFEARAAQTSSLFQPMLIVSAGWLGTGRTRVGRQVLYTRILYAVPHEAQERRSYQLSSLFG